MAGSAASAAAGRVADLAIKEASFLCGVHGEVESLRDDLRSMQTFLSVEEETQHGSSWDAIVADSVRRVRDAAYEAENIIDVADYRAKRNSRRKGMLGAISRYAHKPMDLVARHKLGKDVLRYRKKIQEIKSSREFLDAMKAEAPEPRANHRCLSRLAVDYDDESSVVGLERDVERIGEWLKDPGTPQLTIISIVAMGGAGKTTLARKVYNSAAAKEHFDAVAFVSISQQFEVHPVLKEIATQAMGIRMEERGFNKIGKSGQADELNNMDAKELARMLHNFLNGKRYLIVLDDVWRTDTWATIQHAFPDEGNGSIVMLTTRKMQVAKQANKLTHVHEVMLLNEEESWQLFSLKAFPSYENIDASNRQELETVGKNLAKKCSGLPLSLVILGSHLSKNLSRHTWSKMDQCLDWELMSKGDNMKQIIALSYDDLPSHSLKHRFLYISRSAGRAWSGTSVWARWTPCASSRAGSLRRQQDRRRRLRLPKPWMVAVAARSAGSGSYRTIKLTPRRRWGRPRGVDGAAGDGHLSSLTTWPSVRGDRQEDCNNQIFGAQASVPFSGLSFRGIQMLISNLQATRLDQLVYHLVFVPVNAVAPQRTKG